MKLNVFCAVTTLFLLSACNSYVPKQVIDGNLGAAANSPDFATVRANIFQPYCVSCHSSAGGNMAGINLETYANVVRYIDAVQGSIVTRQTMPMGAPLSPALKQLLNTWIANGAPEVVTGPALTSTATEPSSGETPPTPVEQPLIPVAATTAPTFTALVQNIFQPKCAMCHGAGSSTPVMNYNFLIQDRWIVANDLSDSQLYQSVSQGRMPMGQKLSKNEIDAIAAWINDGAKK